jgi:uncharacterized membrane protein
MNISTKIAIILFIILAGIGFIDATYLTITHFGQQSVICDGTNTCDLVLTSEYSEFYGVPVAFFGVLYYLTILILASLCLEKVKTNSEQKLLKKMFFLTPIGFLGSLWFTYLQAFVIKYYCTYCLFSALISTLLFAIFLYFIFCKKCRNDLTKNISA